MTHKINRVKAIQRAIDIRAKRACYELRSLIDQRSKRSTESIRWFFEDAAETASNDDIYQMVLSALAVRRDFRDWPYNKVWDTLFNLLKTDDRDKTISIGRVLISETAKAAKPRMLRSFAESYIALVESQADLLKSRA